MGKLIDLTGQRFGRLTVIERAENATKGEARWRCLCDCGRETISIGTQLRSGRASSCKCANVEKFRKCAIQINTKHGNSQSRLYNIFTGMKQRCYNPKSPIYKRYGGRGITICEEWLHSFQAFWDWAIANGYRDDLSIDRIDNDKGYSPDNCRWVTQKEQNRNVSTNRRITINGKTMTLMQWCEKHNIGYSTARGRLLRGWTTEEALGLVPRKK